MLTKEHTHTVQPVGLLPSSLFPSLDINRLGVGGGLERGVWGRGVGCRDGGGPSGAVVGGKWRQNLGGSAPLLIVLCWLERTEL